ncbi:MAG TPA: ATP-binding protein, partial [Longimicrobiales bacterium]
PRQNRPTVSIIFIEMSQVSPNHDVRQMKPQQTESGSPPERGRVVRTMLRVPLFYKIMLANVAIVVAVAAVGSSVTSHLTTASRADTVEAVVLFAFAGGIAVVLANAFILRLALLPLEHLEEAAARVQAGDLHVRVDTSPVADAPMERLVETFNAMLDSLAEYRKKQRDLSVRALNAAEEERKRVATDLHDKTAQTLAGLLVRLSLVKSVNDPEVRAALLKEAAEEASFAMDEVYRVVQALRPPALEMLGLKGAIEAQARTIAEKAGIEVEVQSEDLRGALDSQAEIAVYRILQEALSNVVRHARATRAVIHLRRSNDGVLATIEDNGVGFAADEVLRESRSLGLFGMQERASYLGGTVEIRSGNGGTTVEVQIPVS